MITVNKGASIKLYMVISESGGWEGSETVEGVYTTPELAAHAAKLYGGADVREILTDVIPEHPEGCYVYDVQLYRDGKLLYLALTNINNFVEEIFSIHPYYESKTALFRLLAKDEDHAIQIARERGAVRIANGEWPPGRADRDLIPMGSKAEGSK